jgi:hypothetical protein
LFSRFHSSILFSDGINRSQAEQHPMDCFYI